MVGIFLVLTIKCRNLVESIDLRKRGGGYHFSGIAKKALFYGQRYRNILTQSYLPKYSMQWYIAHTYMVEGLH